MNIALSLNGDSSSLDVIKYCALYFDHIYVDTPFDVHTIIPLEKMKSKNKPYKCDIHFLPLYDIDLLTHAELLEKEGILEKRNPIWHSDEKSINSVAKTIVATEIIKHFTSGTISPVNTTKKGHNIKITGNPKTSTPELLESFNNVFSENALNDLIKYKLHGQNELAQFYCLLSLYSHMLNGIFCHVCFGENVATNSNFLNDIVTKIYTSISKTNNHKECQIALNALPILLPNIRDASMEDILEIRLNASDELLELRNYIDNLAQTISPEKFYSLPQQELQKILNQKIAPAIRQLERKMKDIKISATQKFINNMANPMYYAPLLTSLFTNISIHQTLLASLGLITADSIMEYCKNKNNIKNDALYFSIKLRDRY